MSTVPPLQLVFFYVDPLSFMALSQIGGSFSTTDARGVADDCTCESLGLTASNKLRVVTIVVTEAAGPPCPVLDIKLGLSPGRVGG